MAISSRHRQRVLKARRARARSNDELVQSDRAQLNEPEHSEHVFSQLAQEKRNLHPVEKFLAEQPEHPDQPDLLISDELLREPIRALRRIYDVTVELFPHLRGKSYEEVCDFLGTEEARTFDEKYEARFAELDDDEWWY